MAIPAEFINEMGAPYVHSDIFNFRFTLKNFQSVSGIGQQLKDIIEQIRTARDILKNEADKFLNGKTYQQASEELFGSSDSIRWAAMSAIRNPNFQKEISQYTKLDLSDPAFRAELEKLGFTFFEGAIPTLAELISREIKEALGGKSRVSIDGTKLQKLFINSQKERKFITDTPAFEKDVARMLKKMAPLDPEQVWNLFVKYFNMYAKNIKITTTEDTPENFLKKFHDPFIQAINKEKLRDPSNISGWLGEDFKNAYWTTTGVSFDFISVGDKTEEILRNLVKKQWNIKLKEVPFGTSTSLSHSDWVLKNKENGCIVRAQDKNTSHFLRLAKQSANIPQIIKLQDKINYWSLRTKILEYGSHRLTEQDWEELDYIIANTAWFSRFNTVASKKKRGVNYTSDLAGVRDLINQILAEEIGYFSGIASLDEKNLGLGLNNTFFIIDNIILYPTYLMFDYIIRQLEQGEEQLNRLQVSLGKFTPNENMASSRAFHLAKENAEPRSSWSPGKPYGAGVLKEGYKQGYSILSSLQIERINLRFDIKKILTTAYNLNPEELY